MADCFVVTSDFLDDLDDFLGVLDGLRHSDFGSGFINGKIAIEIKNPQVVMGFCTKWIFAKYFVECVGSFAVLAQFDVSDPHVELGFFEVGHVQQGFFEVGLSFVHLSLFEVEIPQEIVGFGVGFS